MTTATDTDFDGLKYTRDSLAIEAYLVEKHSKDGSAFQHCKCIQEKHLLGLQGLAEEGITLSEDKKEREFYAWLAPAMREIRKEIVDATFNVPNPTFGERITPKSIQKEIKAHKYTFLFDHGLPSETFVTVEADNELEAAILGREEFTDLTGERHKTAEIVERNPSGKRAYLPSRLTEEEKTNPELRHKLASCIKSVEKKACHHAFHNGKHGYIDYNECTSNPVAVCRASVKP